MDGTLRAYYERTNLGEVRAMYGVGVAIAFILDGLNSRLKADRYTMIL
ncbi:hypothetical protein [Coleofasciculus sp. G2-EDA-02]